MRIGYLYELQAYPPRGGNHRHAYEITQRLIDQGHEVAVLDDPTMPRAHRYSSQERGGLEAFVETCDALCLRIDARFLGNLPTLQRCMTLAGDRPVIWEINAPANEALAFSWLGGRTSNRRESPLRWLRRWVHATRQKGGIRREERLRRQLAERVDAAVCVSSALARYAHWLGIDQALVLPNGGPLLSEEELRQRRDRRQDPRFTVLYSGSALYPWQGLNYLADAIRLARQRVPEMHFVIATNQRSEYVPEGDNVTVLEGLDRDGILDAICQADACVAIHPEYTWSPFGAHYSPMKLFEYMACGTAVVTSRIGQMKELLRDGEDALLCDNHPEDILDKLMQLQAQPEWARQIGQAGWRRIQQELNWPESAHRTAALLQKLLDQKRKITS